MEPSIRIATSKDQTRLSDAAPALSVVIPTRNEAGNVLPLLSHLQEALKEVPAEVIFVDDSTDDTPAIVNSAVDQFGSLQVRLLHREPDQRTGGLGGAVTLGLQNARAEYACVMDGDMQHPPELVPVMLQTALEKNADIVVATRRSSESKVDGLNLARDLVSKGLDRIGRIFFPRQLRGVSDPLTGFFLVRIKALDLEALRPKGFKILLEILVRNPRLRKAEVPFVFGERLAGESKASVKEVFRYLNLLWTLRFGQGFGRFLGFALVGLSGIAVNSGILYLATDQLRIYYLISAAVATVGSTLWNFILTEALVYRKAKNSDGRFKRLGLFFVMNSIALAGRTPLIYVLTQNLGMHYVYSNLISLGILTVLRFALADNVIWKKAGDDPQNHAASEWRRRMKQQYTYNIHNIISVVSEGQLPELEPFRVSYEIVDPTIILQLGIPPRNMPKSDPKDRYIHFKEIFGHIGFEVGIEFNDRVHVTASRMLGHSPHVLYTNVIEPILRWTFVKKGYALVHGATIAFGNEAYMITARTDTGKTTTLLKILARQRRGNDRAAFLSDDMTIVSPDGTALTYPKPMTISAHTLRAVNTDTLSFKERLILPFQSRVHSRSGRKAAFLISKTKLPAATINLLVQMLIPPPKYYVQKLVPNVKLSQKGNFAGMFIIERGEGGNEAMDSEEALEVLLKNCEDAYGFPPYESLKEFLYMDDGHDLRVTEQNIIRLAMGELPATRIRSENMDWWCRIPEFVDEQMARDCTCEPRSAALKVNPAMANAGR